MNGQAITSPLDHAHQCGTTTYISSYAPHDIVHKRQSILIFHVAQLLMWFYHDWSDYYIPLLAAQS